MGVAWLFVLLDMHSYCTIYNSTMYNYYSNMLHNSMYIIDVIILWCCMYGHVKRIITEIHCEDEQSHLCSRKPG